MKKFLILPLAALLLIISACAPAEDTDEQGTTFSIYFLTPTGTASGSDALKCSNELLDIDETASIEEKALAVVERLLLGSQDRSLLSPFPKDTELLSLSVRNARATVDFSGIARLNGIELTLADYCLVLSLTAIDGIDSVIISCDGRFMPQQPQRIFKQQDVLLSTGDSVLQQMEVLLYFLDENDVLIPEQRTLDIYEGETQSSVLIAALLAGPEDSSLRSVIPADFYISSVKVENGVCRINIPSASLLTLPQDETAQHLILWSLAESLYSLDYVQEIRLITDGEELDRFGSVPVTGIAERPQG